MKTTYSIMTRIMVGKKKSEQQLSNWTPMLGDYISLEAAKKASEQFKPYVKIIKKTWEVVEESA